MYCSRFYIFCLLGADGERSAGAVSLSPTRLLSRRLRRRRRLLGLRTIRWRRWRRADVKWRHLGWLSGVTTAAGWDTHARRVLESLQSLSSTLVLILGMYQLSSYAFPMRNFAICKSVHFRDLWKLRTIYILWTVSSPICWWYLVRYTPHPHVHPCSPDSNIFFSNSNCPAVVYVRFIDFHFTTASVQGNDCLSLFGCSFIRMSI